MAIIKDGRIAGNDWHHATDEESLPEGNTTVSLKRWREDRARLLAHKAPVGVRLGAADAPEELAAGDLEHLTLIVLEFPTFTDGRLFSTARLLRERWGYRGELRARGNFIRDQVFFLSRVGVDAFECSDGATPDALVSALADFTVKYQAAADVGEPLYRRRR